jgi:ribosome biogenesis GTPase
MSEGNIIIKGVGGLYTVMTPTGERLECRARGNLRRLDPPPAVGDKVSVENNVITAVEERRNILIRPFIANLDKLFIVVALADPDPDPFYIDKLTVIAEHFYIEPIIVFNKCDLGDVKNIVNNYSRTPYKKYMVSALKGEGIEALSHEFEGCTSAFAGFSGAGKSSLLNALNRFCGGDELAVVGGLSEKLSRGKHTTRHAELFPLCGGLVADTPGFGSIELEYFGFHDRSTLINCFPDLAEYSEGCKFSDCQHIKEKGCNLLSVIEDDSVLKSRYDSFRRLYEEMGEYKPWELE